MSGKVGRPTKAAIAARERRAKARYQAALAALQLADAELAKAAVDRARSSLEAVPGAQHDLQQAAYAYVRANDYAGQVFV